MSIMECDLCGGLGFIGGSLNVPGRQPTDNLGADMSTSTVAKPPTPKQLARMNWAWRTVHRDFTSKNGYRWAYPGNWSHAAGPFSAGHDPCPQHDGDGICLAHTFSGASSGGIPCGSILVCGYLPDDVLADSVDKVRVKRAWVAELFDIVKLVGPSANLRSANLRSANLRSADLRYADLRYANLRSADLRYADLRSADLRSADLGSANLRYANLGSANLRSANLLETYGNRETVLPAGWKVSDSGLIVRDKP